MLHFRRNTIKMVKIGLRTCKQSSVINKRVTHVRNKESFLCENKKAMLRLNLVYTSMRRRDSSVGIETSYGLDDRGVGVRVPVGSRIFPSPNRQTGSEVHPTFYPMGTGGSFPGGKAAGA
jgi:hypothetical protein